MIIDSNVLLYALDVDSVKNIPARKFLEKNQKDIVISHQNIFEALRVMSHPQTPNRLTSSQAIATITDLIQNFRVITPQVTTPEMAFALIEKYHIAGTEIFDAYLAATALTNRIKTIVTDNAKHFVKFKEITVVSPFA